MFGEHGWCRSCGVPKSAQCGSLVLQGRDFGAPVGAWVPNWQFDVICLERSLADDVAARGLCLPLRPVEWHGVKPGEAVQVVAPTVGARWFDPDELRERTTAKHGASGARCEECGTWRWLPLASEEMPRYRSLSLPDLEAEVG